MRRLRVLFLDVDGVLNSDAWYDQFVYRNAFGEVQMRAIPRPPLDREAVARLDRIIRGTGAWIVLSTSWRGDRRLPQWLLDHGCSGVVVGRTPYMQTARGREIAHWLQRQTRRGVVIEQFCILDDGADMLDLAPWLVQINPAYGLQDDDVQRAVALLGGA